MTVAIIISGIYFTGHTTYNIHFNIMDTFNLKLSVPVCIC